VGIQTIKERLSKYFHKNKTHRYVNVLQNVLKSFIYLCILWCLRQGGYVRVSREREGPFEGSYKFKTKFTSRLSIYAQLEDDWEVAIVQFHYPYSSWSVSERNSMILNRERNNPKLYMDCIRKLYF